jgi:hypothetical protein
MAVATYTAVAVVLLVRRRRHYGGSSLPLSVNRLSAV